MSLSTPVQGFSDYPSNLTNHAPWRRPAKLSSAITVAKGAWGRFRKAFACEKETTQNAHQAPGFTTTAKLLGLVPTPKKNAHNIPWPPSLKLLRMQNNGWRRLSAGWRNTRGRTKLYTDVIDFKACSYPRIWEEAISPIWEDLRTALGIKDYGAFTILRTKSSSGGRTGERKNQHMIALRTFGGNPGWIWDGRKWVEFRPPKVFSCPDSALIKGDVEFFVVAEEKT